MKWLAEEPRCFCVNIILVRRAEREGADGGGEVHAGLYRTHLPEQPELKPTSEACCVFVTSSASGKLLKKKKSNQTWQAPACRVSLIKPYRAFFYSMLSLKTQKAASACTQLLKVSPVPTQLTQGDE